MIMQKESYVYRNCPIPGGGYVTGFVFHEKYPAVKYIRTDIGGTYGYDPSADRWYSLVDHVTMEDLSETFPIALALDPDKADYLYMACGVRDRERGIFAVSHDRGLSFRYHDMPMPIHGNLNGRGTGYRLIVDKKDTSILYFASQMNGLWVTKDRGENWDKVTSFPEEYTTFVGQSPDGKILIAAGAGVTTALSDDLRGPSLYASVDGGETFWLLKGPKDAPIDGVDFAGHVAQRYSADDKYLYVTYASSGPSSYVRELGYSCDGGMVIAGRIFRFSWEDILTDPDKEGTDITPEIDATDDCFLEYGFSGICAGHTREGLLIASTICRGDGDAIYRSYDHGDTWECILHGLDVGRMEFKTSYMKPEYNGGGNLIHWLTDLKLDPHDESKAWFNTGTGVFRTDDLHAETVTFHDACDGIEETVHLNVYSLPMRDKSTAVLDIVGDLGGFMFRDLDTQCENSFADEKGNRYITCINADYSDRFPEVAVVTPRGNWTGETRGGLILTKDGCRTFERIPLPYGMSDTLDAAFRQIERPNVNSGWVALSPDTKHIVWTVADGIRLPIDRVCVSHDMGLSFSIAEVKGLTGEPVMHGDMKVYADRNDSRYFYGFGNDSAFYISTDSGENFTQIPTPDSFPSIDFGLIDCANKTEIRGDSGYTGAFYAALGREGLWKITFEPAQMKVHVYRLTEPDDKVYCVGLGAGFAGSDFFEDHKALYIVGIIDGRYGFFRTVDECATYTCISEDYQMFGEINSIDGDPNEFGRFYIASGTRGLIYGKPRDLTDDEA